MSKFYEGKPCRDGHTTRYVKNNHCVECRKVNDSNRERDHWSLSYTKVIVPNVNKLFWDSINT